MVFKNLHFETRFQKNSFQAPKMQFLCKWKAKTQSFLFLVDVGVV